MRKETFSVPPYLFSPDEMAQLLRPSFMEKIFLITRGIKNRVEVLKSLKTRLQLPATPINSLSLRFVSSSMKPLWSVPSSLPPPGRADYSLCHTVVSFSFLFYGAFSCCRTIIQLCFYETVSSMWWHHHHHLTFIITSP